MRYLQNTYNRCLASLLLTLKPDSKLSYCSKTQSEAGKTGQIVMLPGNRQQLSQLMDQKLPEKSFIQTHSYMEKTEVVYYTFEYQKHFSNPVYCGKNTLNLYCRPVRYLIKIVILVQ